MSYPYPDVVGQALGLYGGGYGPYGGQAIVGADFTQAQQAAADQMAAFQQAAAAQAAAMQMQSGAYPWPFGCALPPALVDPNFPQRELKSIVASAQCGPQEVETFLPFDNAGVVVAAGATYVLTATANVPFKVIGIKFGSNQASNFDILDAKAGIMPVFAGQGAFSAVACQENATHNILNTPTLSVGQKFTLPVKNTSQQDAPLSPVLRVVCVFGGGIQLLGGPRY